MERMFLVRLHGGDRRVTQGHTEGESFYAKPAAVRYSLRWIKGWRWCMPCS